MVCSVFPWWLHNGFIEYGMVCRAFITWVMLRLWVFFLFNLKANFVLLQWLLLLYLCWIFFVNLRIRSLDLHIVTMELKEPPVCHCSCLLSLIVLHLFVRDLDFFGVCICVCLLKQSILLLLLVFFQGKL